MLTEYSSLYQFQFTPLREGRQKSQRGMCLRTKFQFTPLREGRPGGASLITSSLQFQFTPLREGRHQV